MPKTDLEIANALGRPAVHKRWPGLFCPLEVPNALSVEHSVLSQRAPLRARQLSAIQLTGDAVLSLQSELRKPGRRHSSRFTIRVDGVYFHWPRERFALEAIRRRTPVVALGLSVPWRVALWAPGRRVWEGGGALHSSSRKTISQKFGSTALGDGRL